MGTKNSTDLASKILSELGKKPNQKANDLAKILGAERREVNRCLTYTLAGKVAQDSAYRWSLRKNSPPPSKNNNASKPTSELSRLCRYYLESIGQDTNEGVSTFAASKYGEPEYTELSSLPLMDSDWAWWTSPGVERILGKVKASRANTVAWLGYPVRLREHRTARWHGFFAEPVLLWTIELPEKAGETYRLTDDLPIPNFSVLKTMAMGDASAVAEEAARLDEELGLNNPLEDRPEIDELIERLVSIRPDWDWQEEMHPESCSTGVALSDINKTGIYNRVIILTGERSPFTQGLEAELKQLSEVSESNLAGTVLGRMLSGEWEAGDVDLLPCRRTI